IVFAHPDPNGGAVITDNIVNTDTENAIAGIWQLFSSAPALLDNNTVTVGKAGMGIGSAAAAKSTLRDNTVSLSDPTAAAAGIDLANVTKSLLEDNTVTGGGTGGPDNIALRIVSSAGNVYCCNTLSNTRIGAHISGGSLATDNFRGTSFSNHATSLLLPDVNAILGTQTHTKNRWLQDAGPAVYEVSSNFAENLPFFVDVSSSNGDPSYEPEDFSPEDWFQSATDTEDMDPCDEEVCMVNGFAPESDDVKKIALGDTLISAAVLWELQRYVYERLQGASVSNPTIFEFLARSDTNSIGAFYAIQDGINAMFSADSLERNQLKYNLALVEQKLDSLVHIDEQMLEADSAGIAALMPVKIQLLGDLFELSSDNKDLSEGIWSNVKSEAGKLYSQNDSISATHSFEINEKVVNGLYLNWLDND
ncbi:MAG TPA: NosD domain-containing protein, partial [Saprospiraceae bacterium]|nr:NosD domain-containing protein [Saprospiraceae bacterium]